jgi:hypothetical protein
MSPSLIVKSESHPYSLLVKLAELACAQDDFFVHKTKNLRLVLAIPDQKGAA